jgi:hypothetical protein
VRRDKPRASLDFVKRREIDRLAAAAKTDRKTANRKPLDDDIILFCVIRNAFKRFINIIIPYNISR